MLNADIVMELEWSDSSVQQVVMLRCCETLHQLLLLRQDTAQSLTWRRRDAAANENNASAPVGVANKQPAAKNHPMPGMEDTESLRWRGELLMHVYQVADYN